jgi:hypothetical protein
MTTQQRRCERIASLVDQARNSDAKIQTKSGRPGYRGSIEEMDDLHEWFVRNHRGLLQAFLSWCHRRRVALRPLGISSPAGTDCLGSGRPVTVAKACVS